MVKIMTVYRTNMTKTQLTEQAVPANNISCQVLGALCSLFNFGRESAGHFPHKVANRLIGTRRNQL